MKHPERMIQIKNKNIFWLGDEYKMHKCFKLNKNWTAVIQAVGTNKCANKTQMLDLSSDLFGVVAADQQSDNKWRAAFKED